jgi:hypothetical protein
MKTSIIEVGLPTSNIPRVQPELEACLQTTGDALIGQQIYDDQALFVVRVSDTTIQTHLKTLSAAFRDNLIDSFQLIACYLFKVAFKDESFQNVLRDFPLHPGESWFPAASETCTAYLCLSGSYLSQEQTSWLATQTSIAQWTREP